MKTYPLFFQNIFVILLFMFLRETRRFKDGKDHRYWNIVENKRTSSGQVVQRQVLYLGEINDAQQSCWRKTIEVFDQGCTLPKQFALFPSDRPVPADELDSIQVKLSQLEIKNPRQWGACWLFLEFWDQLRLDSFWKDKLLPSRKGTRWLNVLKTLTVYRLIDPGSEGVFIGYGISKVLWEIFLEKILD